MIETKVIPPDLLKLSRFKKKSYSCNKQQMMLCEDQLKKKCMGIINEGIKKQQIRNRSREKNRFSTVSRSSLSNISYQKKKHGEKSQEECNLIQARSNMRGEREGMI